MSAVVRALSNDGNQMQQTQAAADVDMNTVFKQEEPKKTVFAEVSQGGIKPFLFKHKKSIAKIIFIFLYFILGCVYYNNTIGWTVLESVYFLTVSSK